MDVVDPGSSGRAETDAIVEGPKWAGKTITFSFPTLAGYADYGGMDEVASNFEQFNGAQQAAVRTILAQISSFTGLTFVELAGAEAGSATLRFAMSDEPEAAYAYLPNPLTFGGDAWFNNTTGDFDAPTSGDYDWLGLLHEIGHTLGLGHPHESTPPLDRSSDWLGATVMSYRSAPGDELGYSNLAGHFPQTYMIEDLAALQFLYGANFAFRSTDDTYRWHPATGEMFVNGVGQGRPEGGVIYLTFWDGGGTDLVDLSNYAGGVKLDLEPGGHWTFSAEQSPVIGPNNTPFWSISTPLLYQGDTRSLIENAIGGPGYDIIFGNAVANVIHGGDDRDELDGRGGNDQLFGDGGPDELRGGDGDDSLDGGPGNDFFYGGNGADRMWGGEGDDNLRGEAGDDFIWGDDGIDYIDGGDGNDTLYGGAGDDIIGSRSGTNILYGGEGNDVLDAQGASQTMYGGPGDDFYYLLDGDDTIIELEGEGIDVVETLASFTLPANVEILRGYQSMVDMVLIGNDLDNEIRGGFGNDLIDGGPGADLMMGLAGNDIFYVDNVDDVVVDVFNEGFPEDFDTVFASVSYVLLGRWDLYDAVVHIEKLVLTGSGDLNGTGSDSDNILEGNPGNNILDGREGNDTLLGHLGADTLVGGAGIDTASYAGDEGAVFVNLTLGRGYANASFGDILDSIENVIGTDYNDFLIGDPGANRLDGAGGDDILIGGFGGDAIVGGGGVDWASYEDNSGAAFANLTLGRGYNNNAEGDTYEGIENLIGGLMDDFFIGDDQANRLNGAMGADTLLGAGGADAFMFTYAPGATSIWGHPNVDLILDFTTGVDKIELASSAFPGLAVGALAAAAFFAGAAAHDADDRIVYDSASGKLWFDPDGTGGQAAMLFATLGETSHPAAIAASDFVVV